MMLGISTTFANDTIKSVEVVLSQDKSLVSEIVITEISQPSRMTIVYDTIQTFKVSEDAKPWITPDLAYQLVEIWDDDNMYTKHIWLPENIKIYPKWTKLFVNKQVKTPQKLFVSENGIISYELVHSMEKHQSTPLSRSIFVIIFGSLVLLFFSCIPPYDKEIKIINFKLFIMICFIIAMASINTIWDGLLIGIIAFGPAYLSSFFLFPTRRRKIKLVKDGWKVEQPLKVFENGDLLLMNTNKINGEFPIRLFDKKYRMKKYKPYSCEEKEWSDGLFYLIYDREKMTYGLFDTESWTMVLDIKYKYILNYTGKYLVSTTIEGEKPRLFDLNERRFSSDAKTI